MQFFLALNDFNLPLELFIKKYFYLICINVVRLKQDLFLINFKFLTKM